MGPEGPQRPVGGARPCFLAQNPDGPREAILEQTRICSPTARRRIVVTIDRGVTGAAWGLPHAGRPPHTRLALLAYTEGMRLVSQKRHTRKKPAFTRRGKPRITKVVFLELALNTDSLDTIVFSVAALPCSGSQRERLPWACVSRLRRGRKAT